MTAIDQLIRDENDAQVGFFDRATRVREQLLAGTYDETGHPLDVAADRLADELLDAGRPEAPALPDGFACNDFDALG